MIDLKDLLCRPRNPRDDEDMREMLGDGIEMMIGWIQNVGNWMHDPANKDLLRKGEFEFVFRRLVGAGWDLSRAWEVTQGKREPEEKQDKADQRAWRRNYEFMRKGQA